MRWVVSYFILRIKKCYWSNIHTRLHFDNNYFSLPLNFKIIEKRMLKYIILILKGSAMGMADVVPGVSGGTIAFISGIYEELINSIKSANLQALRLFFTGRFSDFWRHINGKFLLPVLSGIAISVLSL